MTINPATLLFAEALVEGLATLGIEETIENAAKQITICPYPEKGQFALKAFKYAAMLKKNPQEIAKILSDAVNSHANIQGTQADGAYVNGYINNTKLAHLLLAQIDPKSGKVFYPKIENTKKVLVEFSQPNTHKELHIGHARNVILGDVLCNLFRHVGHKVYSENYHGDEGAHVAKCIWFMEKHNLRPKTEENKGTWLGSVYKDATTAITNAEGTENEVLYREEISAVLEQIENRSGPFYDVWTETRQWSLDLFKEVYEWLGVHFDNWTCESEVSEDSFKIVQDYYKRGVFVKSDGAIGADLSAKKLGFCLLLKSDGRGLYATKDIALAVKRFETVNPDSCIYVVDNRQTFHFQQIFATLEVMGFDISKQCHHLAYDVVETIDGPMSSRKGTIVPFIQLVDELEEKCRNILLSRDNAESIDKSEIDDKAHKIATAAIRYGMIKVDPDSKIVFDMDSWLKLEGNTGPYLLYSYVRMNSILAKVPEGANKNNISWDKLDTVHEKHFLTLLSQFNAVSSDAVLKLKPNIFANYMYDLARTYSAMYNDSPILSENRKDTRDARIALTKLGSHYLRTGLNLLGVPILEKM